MSHIETLRYRCNQIHFPTYRLIHKCIIAFAISLLFLIRSILLKATMYRIPVWNSRYHARHFTHIINNPITTVYGISCTHRLLNKNQRQKELSNNFPKILELESARAGIQTRSISSLNSTSFHSTGTF